MPMAKQDDEMVHELRDLEVQEVSLVDRPANKRKFLIVKNAEAKTMAKGAELKKDGEGSLENADQVADTETPNTEGDAPTPTDEVAEDTNPADEEFEEVELSDLKIDEEVAKAMGSALARAAKRLSALAAAVQSAEKEKGASPSPALMRQVSAIARTLSNFGDKSDGGKDKEADKAKKDEELDLDAVVSEVEAEIEKAGRKMSRSRIRQLRAAQEALSKILTEVDDEEKNDTKKSADPRVDELVKQVALLTKAVGDQQTIIKSQSDAIKKSKSGRPSPNSGTVDMDDESLDRVKKSWPVNFNDEEVPDEEVFR